MGMVSLQGVPLSRSDTERLSRCTGRGRRRFSRHDERAAGIRVEFFGGMRVRSET